MRIRIEVLDESEFEYFLSILAEKYSIINVSGFYQNRPPSKAFRVYIEVGKKEN